MTDKTLKNWIKLHKDRIILRKCKLISDKGMDPGMLDQAQTFCAQILEMREWYPKNHEYVVNYDETRIYVGQGGQDIVESTRKGR